MEGFKTFTEAFEQAAAVCRSWKDPENGTAISLEEMRQTAMAEDVAFDLGENEFYTVFPDGEIGLLNAKTKELYVLFLPGEAAEDSVSSASPRRFCRKCGAPLEPGWKFCMKCGGAVPADPSVCASCGAVLTPGAKFCMACGAKVTGGAK